MQRPASVVASAIVAILGSVFFLFTAVMMFAAPSLPVPPAVAGQPAPPPAVFMFIIGVIFAAMGGLGIVTAIGLLRLRPWARVSILLFAAFMAVGSGMIVLMGLAAPIPIPPEAPPEAASMIRPMMVVMFGIPFAIAVWWLVQFNLRSVKDAFAAASPDAVPPRRPLSITVIAGLTLFGGLGTLIPAIAPMPGYFFGLTFTGWSATLYYVFLGALSLFIGWGLLKLDERARLLAIAWYCYSMVHMAAMTLIPPLHRGMLEAQEAMMAGSSTPMPPGYQSAINTMALLGVAAWSSISIWFLVRRRAAFQSPTE